MFDLFRSRAKSMRYLLIVLLSLVALSMVITLIPGFGSGMSSAQDDAVARIGDEVVTTRYISQVLEQQFRSGQLNRAVAEIAIPTIVNQVVGELSTAYQARRMGFAVSDQELIQGIQTLAPQFFQNGEFVGKEAYQAMLAQMNLTIPEFERKVRQQLLLDKLQRVAFDGIVVAPRELEAEYQKRTEKSRLEVVKFDPTDLNSTISPTRQEMEDHLKANQLRYQIPAKRDLGIIIADADRLGEALAIPEDEIRRQYETNKTTRYTVNERVKVRHILVKADSNASKEDKAKAKAKAEDLLKQIKGGADFAELAKKNSDDPGSGSNGGDLDWVQRGQMVPPFENAAFSLKPKEVSNIVETMFGYHIVQTMERQDAHTRTLDEVKAEILSEARKRQLFEKMPAIIEQARDEILKAPSQAQAIAGRLGLIYQRLDGAGLNANYPVLGASRDLDAAVAGLASGGVSPVVQTKDSKLVIAVAHNVIPPRPAQLSEAEAGVRAAIVETKARELSEKRAKEFEQKLRASGNDLRKVAQEFNMKVIDTGDFERTGTMKDVGSAAYFGEQAFINPVGQVVGLYRIGNNAFFFKIIARTPGDPAGLEAQRAAIVSGIKERKLRERRELFEEGLVYQLKQEGKVKVNEDVIKRIANAYRAA
jgi:peptidyl-prolyl cis-trans isomerase D